jgi:hypothetical protein
MATIVLANQVAPAVPSSGQCTGYFDSTKKRWSSKDDAGVVTNYPVQIVNASAVGASAAFATDTYLTGSNVTIPVAGDWAVGESYTCVFDLTKTGAGTATFIITVRMGTAGTTGDASIMTFTFGAGTANADTGRFAVELTFQSVGGGTSAVLAGIASCGHLLAATGLTNTGAAGFAIIQGTSSGFNSTTQTIIGLSINGGASFSGTNTIVQSSLRKV